MISPGGRFFSYALVRCADPARDEHLNVGVVLLDEEGMDVRTRMDPDLRRVTSAFPTLPESHIRNALDGARGAFRELVQREGLDGLARVGLEWQNLIRLSAVRSIRASDSDAAIDLIFDQYVSARSGKPARETPPAASTDRLNYTSRRIVNGVVKRLRQRQMSEGEHFEMDREVTGLTRERRSVPVWYPLAVARRGFLDAFRMSATDARNAWDAARLVSQKAEETLRADSSYYVVVTIQKLGDGALANEVAAMVREESAINGRAATVHVIQGLAELESVAATFDSPPLFGR